MRVAVTVWCEARSISGGGGLYAVAPLQDGVVPEQLHRACAKALALVTDRVRLDADYPGPLTFTVEV